jgi:hypothetical protein
MIYKKKLNVLSGIIAALALIYILTIIFDPERRGARSAAYSWLDPAETGKISGITIANKDEVINLARNGGKWFVSHDGKDYPAKTARVEDFIAALAKRAPYPLRSSSASSHERLSLTDDQSARVTVAAGAGLPLLNLLIGQSDLTGQNVYRRKQGQNEVRSGEDIFSIYTGSGITAWYNLRLFSESEGGKLDTAYVQRLTIYPPANDSGETHPQIFTRKGKEWTFNFELARPDMKKVDNYIRDIINTSGDDFAASVSSSDSMFNNSRIVLELGNGSAYTVRLSPPDEDGKCYAAVSGSDWVYSIPEWVIQRLFPGAESFEIDSEKEE